MKNDGIKRGWSPVPEATDPKPWYQHLWPWILISLPLAAVVAGVATLFIAMDEPDSLVVGDYYKQGLAINRTLAREEAARAQGLQGSLRIHVATGRVSLEMTMESGPETLELKLFHATRDRHDGEITLRALGGNRYGGQLQASLSPGGWILHLEPPDAAWRISGRTRITSEPTAEIDIALTP